MSPVASTMSQDSLRTWDSWIRPWVRHPHIDGLWESLCYQVHLNGSAALVWRYEDRRAAERHDMRGGPLVSRVLVGHASLLTPDVAIVLCRTGLPAAAGMTPGQVTAGTGLSVLEANELSALVNERVDRLDEEAAGQEGLRQVVAAALSNPDSPLAIYLDSSHILRPPGEGMQCPLLWGLWRIVWPLLGNVRRGWSFSTFEPPPGDMDPTALPDILFRQAQGTLPTGLTGTREEIKCSPLDPGMLDDESLHTQLADWLVAEYQERGGDELRQLIADWCGAERSPQVRLRKVHDELRARYLPLVLPRIFICYRREETGWVAGWLFDRLAIHFGRDQVFKDVDSVELGDDFVEVITAAVGSCDAFLALIGNQWLMITDQVGRRRLDNPDDFVRLEIEAALERGVRVIPILVDGARMPIADQLPESLAPLARRHALELSPGRFGRDLQRLITALRRAITSAQEQGSQQAEEAARRHQPIEQLQERLRERAAAQDWDTVVAPTGEPAELDPAAVDPDALASTASQHFTRRQQSGRTRDVEVNQADPTSQLQADRDTRVQDGGEPVDSTGEAANAQVKDAGTIQAIAGRSAQLSVERDPMDEAKHKVRAGIKVRTRALHEAGEVAKRYHLAIKQLRYGDLESRIAAIQGLGRVGRDSAKYRARVIEALTDFIQELSGPNLSPDVSMARQVRKRQPNFRKDLRGAYLVDPGLIHALLVKADLTGENLANVDLAYADLAGADLTDADLSGAKLVAANLIGTKLVDATLGGADLTYADLIGAKLVGADLTGADLSNADLTGANLAADNLTGTDLFGTSPLIENLPKADLTNASLVGAALANARLIGTTLVDADLTGANLTGADLSGADMMRAVLIDVDLTQANLSDADLSQANLTRVNLTDANLRGTKLSWANLDGADLSNADIGVCGTAFATDFHFAWLTHANLTSVDLNGIDFTFAYLAHSRWPEASPPPAGWVRDPGSGTLKRARDKTDDGNSTV